MQSIPNVATSDGYAAACTLGPDPLATQLVYVVANAAVYAQFRPISSDGTAQDYGPEVLLTPTANTVQRCAGVQFRSAVAGVPARIVAQLLEPADPQFGGGVPFSSTLAASGALAPGVASVQVMKDAALVGTEAALNLIGTRWAVADNAVSGRIDITPTLGFEKIAGTVLTVAAGSITFSSISQTYRSLMLLLSLVNDTAADQSVLMRLNGDSLARYRYQRVYGQGATAAGQWDGGALQTSMLVGDCPSAGVVGWYTPSLFVIPGYATGRIVGVAGISAHLGTSFVVGTSGGIYNQAVATTSLTLLPSAGNFGVGSLAQLYGIPA